MQENKHERSGAPGRKKTIAPADLARDSVSPPACVCWATHQSVRHEDWWVGSPPRFQEGRGKEDAPPKQCWGQNECRRCAKNIDAPRSTRNAISHFRRAKILDHRSAPGFYPSPGSLVLSPLECLSGRQASQLDEHIATPEAGSAASKRPTPSRHGRRRPARSPVEDMGPSQEICRYGMPGASQQRQNTGVRIGEERNEEGTCRDPHTISRTGGSGKFRGAYMHIYIFLDNRIYHNRSSYCDDEKYLPRIS